MEKGELLVHSRAEPLTCQPSGMKGKEESIALSEFKPWPRNKEEEVSRN